jgi:hypothetical protein
MEIISFELTDNKYEGINVPEHLITDVCYIENIVQNEGEYLVLNLFIQDEGLKEYLAEDLEQTIAKQKLIEYLTK